MCMCMACMYVYALCVFSVLRRQKAALDPCGSGAIDSCEPPCRCSEANPGSAEEQPAL